MTSLTSSWMSQVIGSGVMTCGHAQPAEAVAAVVDEPQDVALGEDADQLALVVDDGQRADVVLDELGDRLVDRRLGVDRDDAIALGLRTSRTSMVHSPGRNAETAPQGENRLARRPRTEDRMWTGAVS